MFFESGETAKDLICQVGRDREGVRPGHVGWGIQYNIRARVVLYVVVARRRSLHDDVWIRVF